MHILKEIVQGSKQMKAVIRCGGVIFEGGGG
jgi:hypothetical protein